MPAFESKDLYQRAVLWKRVRYDGSGRPVAEEPVEIRVRWTDKQSEALDPRGSTITVDATVVTNRDIPVESVLAYGTLDDWQGTGSGLTETGLMVVKTVDKATDLKNRFARRTYGLMKFRNVPPETV